MRHFFSAAFLLGSCTAGLAQEPVRLVESFLPGHQYQVRCRVEISGTLSLPPQKDGKAPTALSVSGASAIDYDERILSPLKDKADRPPLFRGTERTLRIYRRMDFRRKVGAEVQETSLRPEVSRMVMLRHDQIEVPFSPDGPLSWNELDLVRTDVFTPALAGLLAPGAVKVGDRWNVTEPAVRELTDLHRIESGQLVCTFESITTLAGRRLARVKLAGAIQGINEDGPTRHEIDGYCLFDLESRHLSYLSMKGGHILLDKEGKQSGKIDGTFVLSREPVERVKELDEKGLALEPTEENTLLVMDVPELGVRFLHPRRWRVAAIQDKRITLDDQKGSGLLLTIEPLATTPTGLQFLEEARNYLASKRAPLDRFTKPKPLGEAPHIEQFTIDTEVDRQAVWLDYYVARFPTGGATLAARLLPPEQAALQREVARIARSIQMMKRP